MKVLIVFALRRRFLNKATILLNILTFIIAGGLLFADKIVKWFDPDCFAPLKVYLSSELYAHQELFGQMPEWYVLLPDSKETLQENELRLVHHTDGWEVIGLYGADALELQKITYLVQSYEQAKWQATHDPLLWEDMAQMNAPSITVTSLQETDVLSSDRQTLAFLLLTTVYFTTLSFCSVIASEVVYEKTSRILELILTSVTPRVHFFSKMLVGWLTIVIQNGMTLFSALFWFSIRQGYDHGSGLLWLTRQLGLLQADASSFRELIKLLDLDTQLVGILALVLFFLLLGILFIQLIMAILSSYVTSIEESSNIQAPCYLILMAVYYLALSLNNPYQMSAGIGKWLSFLPFFSMLFMPCRLLLGTVTGYEVLISAVLAIGAVVLVLDFGAGYYERGILDNTVRAKVPLVERLIAYRKNKEEKQGKKRMPRA